SIGITCAFVGLSSATLLLNSNAYRFPSNLEEDTRVFFRTMSSRSRTPTCWKRNNRHACGLYLLAPLSYNLVLTARAKMPCWHIKGVESTWSPNGQIEGVGVHLASKSCVFKSFVFSEGSLYVIDIFCLGCKRSGVQIPAARPNPSNTYRL